MREKFKFKKFFSNYSLYLILAFLIIVSASLSPLFISYKNIVNLLMQGSFSGLLAIGMTFVILTGGIDLSVGSIVGFSSILFATLLHGSIFTFMPKTIFIYKDLVELSPLFYFPLNILFVVFVGSLIGFINGIISYKFRIHSFIITLAMMIFIRGLAISYTDGQPLFGMPIYVEFLAYGEFLKVPMPIIIWIASAFISGILLKFTLFGRQIYAVGGNEEAARLSGLNIFIGRVAPFVISGFFAALVGIIMSGRMSCGDPKIAKGWELNAIAAVVIGGTSLFGGKGSITGTLIGTLIVALLINIMNLLEMSAYHQEMTKGLIIILSLVMQNILRKNEIDN